MPVPTEPKPDDTEAVEPAVDPEAIEELDEEAIKALLRRLDPMSALAEITGDADGERFWDRLVESRNGHAAEAFAAISEAMAALRERAEIDEETLLREAAMRREIRAAVKTGADARRRRVRRVARPGAGRPRRRHGGRQGTQGPRQARRR